MTQRTYKGKVAPDWAEYVVFGPLSGAMYWATDTRRYSALHGNWDTTLHVRHGWRREELDPLPVEEVWLVLCPGYANFLQEHHTEAAASEEALSLARQYAGRAFIVARATQKITQPKPVLPEPIVEKL